MRGRSCSGSLGSTASRGARRLPAARLNGAEIAYDVAGDGPAVVLLHAGVGDRRLWDGQSPLAERYLVVRPDLRGFGDSALPGGPFSFVDDVRALLDHLEIERAALVGNSFGGKIALDVALTAPERTSALVLVAAALAGREDSRELTRLDATEDELLDAGRIDEAVELSLRAWLDGPDRGAAPVPPGVRQRLAGMQRRAYEVAVAAYARDPEPGPVSWASPPAADRLGEVAPPTLVVVGRHDFADFRKIGDELEAGIPGARKVVLDTAHLPGVERPEELNRLLLDFLGEHAA